MFVKSIVEVFIKPTIQAITGVYFSSLFLCFCVFVFCVFFFFLKDFLISHK